MAPSRNEARNLEIVLPALAALRPAVHQIIVVDGHPTDGSLDTARRVLPWVRTLTQTRTGKGNTMACGFAAVTGDIVGMFDANGSADPAEIPVVVAARLTTAEVASVERRRMFGDTNLRTFRDGARVLRRLLAERRRRTVFSRGMGASTADPRAGSGHRIGRADANSHTIDETSGPARSANSPLDRGPDHA